jgi:hypothetical protein
MQNIYIHVYITYVHTYIHTHTQDGYAPYNKPYAIEHWLKHSGVNAEYIIIVDPDCVFLRPLAVDTYGGGVNVLLGDGKRMVCMYVCTYACVCLGMCVYVCMYVWLLVYMEEVLMCLVDPDCVFPRPLAVETYGGDVNVLLGDGERMVCMSVFVCACVCVCMYVCLLVYMEEA